jgi:Zn-finger nucleic acid-binding protein
MNCPNCAAAMELVESRRYFVCRHCGTNHFPQTIEQDGIRIVGHPASAPKCPVCNDAMAHALLDDDHPVDFCTRCRGLLLPRTTFATVVNTRRPGPPTSRLSRSPSTGANYTESWHARVAKAGLTRIHTSAQAASSSTTARGVT